MLVNVQTEVKKNYSMETATVTVFLWGVSQSVDQHTLAGLECATCFLYGAFKPAIKLFPTHFFFVWKWNYGHTKKKSKVLSILGGCNTRPTGILPVAVCHEIYDDLHAMVPFPRIYTYLQQMLYCHYKCCIWADFSWSSSHLPNSLQSSDARF